VTSERLELAEAFLREAVFRAREQQSSAALFTGQGGECGLGGPAEAARDLTPRASEILRGLWPSGSGGENGSRARAVAAAWVAEQDRLDRKRNHFLKAFRAKHGFERAAYAPDVLREYEQGLERINDDENERRRAAAAELLAPRARGC
jgi:hypothetical protein